jgi:predicted permease
MTHGAGIWERLARALIAFASMMVPWRRRGEWREEWLAELWHASDATRSGERLSGVRLALRSLGAMPHAVYLRVADWRSDTMVADVRYALRVLRKQPLFTVIAVVTLALGIGGNTALFSIVNAVLLRPLPFREAERLVWVRSVFSGGDQAAVSPPDYRDYRAESRSFEAFAAMATRGQRLTLTGGGQPEEVSGITVSANFLPMLRVEPVLGRGFTEAEEAGAFTTVAMISEELWRRRYGGSRDVLGRVLQVDGRPHTIVGVVPARLAFPAGRDVWVPLTMGDSDFTIRGAHFLRPIARLRAGVTVAQAQAEVDAIAIRLEAAYPQSNTTWRLRLVPLQQQLVGASRGGLLVLLGAVGLVLLIACANVASLMLARATARRGEIAVRAALGASRGRVVRQLVVESMMVALMAGAAGMLVTRWLLALVVQYGAQGVPRLGEVVMDGRVLGFTLLLTAATGLAFGVWPAMHTTTAHVSNALRQSGRGRDRAGGRARSVLVAIEVALCTVLLVGSALLLRSFDRLTRADPGFETRGRVAMRFQLPSGRYGDPAAKIDAAVTVRERLLALPGVLEVGAINAFPVLEFAGDTRAYAANDPPPSENEWRGAQVRIVTPGYFEAMQIGLVRGRTFDGRDHANAEKTVIVNDALARQFFGDGEALGEELVIGIADRFHARIVGVVRGVRQFSLATPPAPEFYLPLAQAPATQGLTFVIRAADRAAGLMPAIRREVLRIDGEQPVSTLARVEDLLAESVASPRFRTALLTAFAVMALLLSAIGIYGIVAYNVTQRRREIGVRLALGARTHRLVRGIIVRGLVLAVAGLISGLVIALPLTRVLQNELYEIEPRDGAAFGVALLVILMVTTVASAVPALRAGRIDPAVTLREE